MQIILLKPTIHSSFYTILKTKKTKKDLLFSYLLFYIFCFAGIFNLSFIFSSSTSLSSFIFPYLSAAVLCLFFLCSSYWSIYASAFIGEVIQLIFTFHHGCIKATKKSLICFLSLSPHNEKYH